MSQPSEFQTCLVCGEENPADAVMCWACYTPAGTKDKPGSPNGPTIETTLEWEDEFGYCHPVPPKTWREKFWRDFPGVFYLAIISAGWWRGKTRFAVLGTGIAGAFVLGKWEDRARRERERAYRQAPPRQDDSGRMVDSLLRLCVQAGASGLRIVRGEKGLLLIEFRLENQWRPHLKLERGYWTLLESGFTRRIKSNAIKITDFGVMIGFSESGRPQRLPPAKVPLSPDEQNASFALRLVNEPPRGEITLMRL